jgi:hypothetical protein
MRTVLKENAHGALDTDAPFPCAIFSFPTRTLVEPKVGQRDYVRRCAALVTCNGGTQTQPELYS